MRDILVQLCPPRQKEYKIIYLQLPRFVGLVAEARNTTCWQTTKFNIPLQAIATRFATTVGRLATPARHHTTTRLPPTEMAPFVRLNRMSRPSTGLQPFA